MGSSCFLRMLCLRMLLCTKIAGATCDMFQKTQKPLILKEKCL